MQVESVRKGRTSKVVTLSGVTEVNDDAVRKVAYAAAGETASSLFGSSVAYFGDEDSAVVTLYTD